MKIAVQYYPTNTLHWKIARQLFIIAFSLKGSIIYKIYLINTCLSLIQLPVFLRIPYKTFFLAVNC